jgi:hypothetical protein
MTLFFFIWGAGGGRDATSRISDLRVVLFSTVATIMALQYTPPFQIIRHSKNLGESKCRVLGLGVPETND